MTYSHRPVLIVGAGPTGLTLALWLRRLGVSVRIVDKASAPGETSRALAVQARTLEFDRQIGIVDDVLAAGIRIEHLDVHTPAGLAASLPLSSFGAGESPYPFAFALPQDVHERILIEHLEKAGVAVERETEIVALRDCGDEVLVTLRRRDATETVRAAYLCGCDGARSFVRHALNIDFPGGSYDQSFYVADVRGTGAVAKGGMDVMLDAYGFAIVMPVRQSGSLRLIGIVPKAHENANAITFGAIRADIERDTGVSVKSVNWFSTYRAHHRVAERFRVGRIFLAGDAGHIHSPAGGQGMNTGIGDAVNLAWKLAAVLQGRADKKLLDSYEAERIAFAHRLIATTDRMFRMLTTQSPPVALWRRYLMPRVMKTILSFRFGARLMFRTVSQVAIAYPKSPISAAGAGKLRGGDRLPYVAGAQGDNFAPLQSLDWQVHIYGAAKPAMRAASARVGIALHEFAFTPAAKAAGFVAGAAYLVRPDGHIATADAGQNPAPFESYLASLGVKPRRRNLFPYPTMNVAAAPPVSAAAARETEGALL